MATSFPGTVQTFDKRLDLVETDAPLVKQYQEAMQNEIGRASCRERV